MAKRQAVTEERPGEIVVRARPIGQMARSEFTRAQVDTIRATVARDANDAELAMFLELCARYQLDPFAGQLYCARMKGKNGQPGRIAIIAGRDTFLTIANRDDDYEGWEGDAIYEADSFVKRHDPVGGVQVTHVVNTINPKERGELIGAWAVVRRRSRKPVYFLAYASQYVPAGETNPNSPWLKQRDVMMGKCALSTALRLAFSITGLVGEEEAAHQLARGLGQAEVVPASEIEWGDDESLAGRLASLFSAANDAREGSFLPPKIKMMLAGKSQGEREQIARDLEEFIVEHGGVLPGSEEPEEAEEAEWAPSGEIDDSIPFGVEDEQPPER